MDPGHGRHAVGPGRSIVVTPESARRRRPSPGIAVRWSLVAGIATLSLLHAACKREDPEAAAAAVAAQREQQEAAADALAAQFDEAFAQENWTLARGYGDQLLMEHPASAAAGRIRARLDEAKANAAAEAERRRMTALWAYQTEPVRGGNQASASIYAKDRIDTDGSGARQVRLIFRDHPQWGRSSYLVLERGDFACRGGCRVQVAADGAAPKAMAASRPKTDEAIAMFIEDERALWRTARGAQRLSIAFPVQAGGTRTAVFEVGGLDGTKLPGWD